MGRFYQQFVSMLTNAILRAESQRTIVGRLIRFADHAHAVRRTDVLKQVSDVISELPLGEEYKHVGRYYEAMWAGRQGRIAEASTLLESVAERGPLMFRARAISSLAGYSCLQGDVKSALPIYLEAGRAAQHLARPDPIQLISVHKMMAALKGEDGDHRRSVDDLERIFPLARMVGRAYPPLLSDYLNSYAVELAALGRLEEAGNVSRIVLASPYANAYPEWRETADDIAGRGLRPSRSRVGFCEAASTPDNVLRFSEFERSEDSPSLEPRLGFQPAQVVDIEEWKSTHMPEESKKDQRPRLSSDQIANMTPGAQRVRLGEILYAEQIPDETLQAILAFAEDALESGKAKPP